MIDRESIEHEIIEICDKLFERAFSCKINDKKVEISPDKIDIQNIKLLFALPGIILTALTTISDDKYCHRIYKKIKKLLNHEKDPQKIQYVLNKLLHEPVCVPNVPSSTPDKNFKERMKNYDPNKHFLNEMSPNSPPIYAIIYLLLHPKSMHYDRSGLLSHFIFSSGNHFLLTGLIIKAIQTKKTEFYYLDSKSFIDTCIRYPHDIFYEKNIFYFSLFFWDLMLKTSHNELEQSANSFNKHFSHLHTVPIPSTKFYLHTIKSNKSSHAIPFGVINSHEKKYNDKSNIGFATDLNMFGTSDYNLWRIKLNDQDIVKDTKMQGGYLFSTNKDDQKNKLENLCNQLYTKGRQSIAIIISILNSWDDFIDKPEKIIDSKLVEFDDWMDSMLNESYEMRSEFFKQKNLSRMIGDIGLSYQIIQDIHQDYNNAKKYHITIELRDKLLKTNKELKNFIKLVREEFKEAADKRGSIERLRLILNKNQEEYEYLKLIEDNDIDKIEFFGGGNFTKKNRRLILAAIYKKLTGKTLPGSTLALFLDLESPSATKPKGYKYAPPLQDS